MLRQVVLISSLLFMAACSTGNLTAIHKRATFKGDNKDTTPVGVFVDAEQRAVLSTMRPKTTTTTFDYSGGNGKTSYIEETEAHRVVCAEPSPDALSAIAAQAGVSVSDLQGSVAAEGALSEVASNIGVRTQTIQTLRDGFYRVCEAYMNGLSDVQYSIMLRRFQTNMIALLAIEQLTGAVRGGDSVVAASAGDLDLNDGLDGAGEGDGRGYRRVGGNTAVAGGTTGSWPAHRDINPGVAVADAVKEISLALINQDYGVQLCLEYLRAGIKDTPLKENCLAVVGGYANGLEQRIQNETRSQTARIEADARMVEARAQILEATASAIRAGTADQTQLDQISSIVSNTGSDIMRVDSGESYQATAVYRASAPGLRSPPLAAARAPVLSDSPSDEYEDEDDPYEE